MYGRAGLDRFKKAQSLEPFSVTLNSASKTSSQPAQKTVACPSVSSFQSPTSQLHPQLQQQNKHYVPQKPVVLEETGSAVPAQHITQVGGGQSTWQPPDWAIEPRPGVYYLEVLKDGEVFDRINLDKRRHIFGRQFLVNNCRSSSPHCGILISKFQGRHLMEIHLGKLPFDLDFHPSSPLVSVGLITGDLHLYRYAVDTLPQRLLDIPAHSESCRAVRFINEGRAILTGSPDCSILATDVETGTSIARLDDAHESAVNRLVNLTETTIASGDDEGCIKVWDTRQRTCCNSFDAHEEYISDMTYEADSMKLLGTGGDGTLSVCSLRKNKVLTQSEFSEEEPLSVVIMKNGKKVVCGTQSGVILLYSWGHFKDCSDRFTGLQSNSVDALLKLDEDRVITGSENGLISLVGILPNIVIQPIAEHSEYPVERLAFSHDRKFLGSISHDQMLKLWDLEDLLNDPGNSAKGPAAASDSDSDEMDVDTNPPKSFSGTKRKKGNNGQSSDNSSSTFFSDLS